ncbi:MAG: cobalt ECF transporter T component CbiQ [Deltaproteobacteria bacterium]|nr:cobalt ECF transporter T component CbiQ [Deltaproteobacteria bacterium]
MINESLSEGNSFIHRLDPRIKLLAAFLFSVVISVSGRFFPLFFAFLMAFILLAFARLPIKTVLLRLLFANLFIFLLWLIIPFTMQGEPLFHLWALAVSKEGLRYCFLLTIKTNSILMILIVLAATMPVFTLGRAMSSLGIPEKIVNLFIFSYRYIHAILLEYKRLREAMEIRGFHPKTNMHTYRSYAYLVGMLIVKSHDRAERVHSAMICRGFQGKFFDLTEFSIKRSDFLFFITFMICLVLIAIIQWLIKIS